LDPSGRSITLWRFSGPAPPSDEHIERLLAEADGVTAVDQDPSKWRDSFLLCQRRSRAILRGRIRAIDATRACRRSNVSDENWAERSQASITAVRVGAITVAPPWDIPPTARRRRDSAVDGVRHRASRIDAPLSPLASGDRRRRQVRARCRHGIGRARHRRAQARRAIVVAADYDPDAIQVRAGKPRAERVEGISLLLLDLASRERSASRRSISCFANLTGAMLQRFAPALPRDWPTAAR
jgi:hypothetical protein